MRNFSVHCNRQPDGQRQNLVSTAEQCRNRRKSIPSTSHPFNTNNEKCAPNERRRSFVADVVEQINERRKSVISTVDDVVGQFKERRRSTMSTKDYLILEGEVPSFASPSKTRRKSVVGFFRNLASKVSEKDIPKIPKLPHSITKDYRKKHRRNPRSGGSREIFITYPLGLSRSRNSPRDSFMHARHESGSMSPKACLRRADMQSIRPLTRSDATNRLTAQDLQQMFHGAPNFKIKQTDTGFVAETVLAGLNADGGHTGASDFLNTSGLPLSPTTIGLTGVSDKGSFEGHSINDTDGLEIGTSSFEHFFRSSLSETLTSTSSRPSSQKLNLLYEYPERYGMRRPDLQSTVKRLGEIGDLFCACQSSAWVAINVNADAVSAMGENLFKGFLDVPKTIGITNIPLRAQIEKLQNVLSIADLWFDFSRPDLQSQAGKLLWDPAHCNAVNEEPSDSEILLLQIALASELLLRIKIHRALMVHRVKTHAFVQQSDIAQMDYQRTTKVDWDLVLAEKFLCGIRISTPAQAQPVQHSAVFSILTKSLGLAPTRILYESRLQEQQLDALLYASATLQWPDEVELHKAIGPADATTGLPDFPADVGFKRFVRRCHSVDVLPNMNGLSRVRAVGTGVSAARLRDHTRGQSQTLQQLAAPTRIAPDFVCQTKSWQVRSWICGFMMPGDAEADCLMQTLLEHSSRARENIESAFDPNSGFVYQGRMFWMKRSVVGKVLAALKSASECMGWISVSSAILGQSNGCIRLDVQRPAYAQLDTFVDHESASKRSGFVGDSQSANIFRHDFAYPLDGPLVRKNEVRLLSFRLKQASATTSIAVLNFASPHDSKLSQVEVALLYDVEFVSAHPCQPLDARIPCHPLHNSYGYKCIPAAALLQDETEHRLRARFDTMTDGTHVAPARMLILDCRQQPNLQLLARAWCAKVGENALVSRVGRTCISCSVREARALNMAVIVRI